MDERSKPQTHARSMWLSLSLAAALSLVGLSAPSARASVVQALDLAGLVANAHVIVLGKTVAQQSHYDAHGRIVTDIEVIVESCEKGGLQAGESVLIRRLGGVVNGVGMRIEGEPTFQIGERTLLFGHGPIAALRPVGMSQGALRVTESAGESWVRSAAAGAALVERGADGALNKAQAAMNEARPLADVLREIRSLVAQSAR
jgi:hypothetical protein